MEGDEVEISKRGASLVLWPKRTCWATFFQSLEKFTDDFIEDGRKQPKLQNEAGLFHETDARYRAVFSLMRERIDGLDPGDSLKITEILRVNSLHSVI